MMKYNELGIDNVELDYRELRQIVNKTHDRFSELNFDESLSLLQKVNLLANHFKIVLKDFQKIVEYLDDFIDKFDENLYETVEDVLNKWYEDGKFLPIMSEILSELRNYMRNVTLYGVVGDYVDLDNRGTDQTEKIQNVLDMKGRIFFPDGKYYVKGTLNVYSNTEIIMSPNAQFFSEGENLFYFGKTVTNSTVTDGKFFHVGNYYSTLFKFDGIRESYATNVKEILIKDCYGEGYDLAFDMNYLRKSKIDNVHMWCKRGFLYRGKSAEVVVSDSNIVYYEQMDCIPTDDFYGFKATNNSNTENDYPEGIVIENTLFFHFVWNLDINDLMVSFINNCYFDSGVAHCKGQRIQVNKRVYRINMDNNWFYRGPMIVTQKEWTSPCEIRSQFTNMMFDELTTTAILVEKWIHQLSINQLNVYGTSSNQGSCFVSLGNNSSLSVSNVTGRFLSFYVQFKGEGENNSAAEINNSQNLPPELVLNTEQPIKFNGVVFNSRRYFKTIESKKYTPNSEVARIGTLEPLTKPMLSEGSYLVKVRLNKITVNAKGYLSIITNTDNYPYYKAKVETTSVGFAHYLLENNTDVNMVFVIQVLKSGYCDFILKANDTLDFNVSDYFNGFEIIKL